MQNGATLNYVIPYNMELGCIIQAPNQRFFPAQIGSSLRGGHDSFPRRDKRLSNVIAASVFQDFFLITLERRKVVGLTSNWIIKEYMIHYRSTRELDDTGREVCQLQRGLHEPARLAVTKHGEDLFIVVCDVQGIVQTVRFMPINARMGTAG